MREIKMEEPSDNGASSGPARALEPPRAPPLEEQKAVAKITAKMPKILASPSSVKTEVQGGETNMYKYRGRSWPGVVGLDLHEAKRIIGEGKPELRFEVLSENAMRTCEGRSMRVRLIVDKYNRVVETPRVG